MPTTGQLRKLVARPDNPVTYWLPLGDSRVPLQPLLGRNLALRHTGKITCVHCGRNTNKSFNQGYCYPCFQRLAQCDSCIVSPERCHYDAGTCREPLWGDHFCMQDHVVYLANSSGIKVGITRASQIPIRWIDQGATQALPVIRTRSRQQAGFCEVLFRQHVTDRTNWRGMLSGEQDEVDLVAERNRLVAACAQELHDLQERFGLHALSILTGVDAVALQYPVLQYPGKITSHDIDKLPELQGKLLGIKGQYLIFDSVVINMRKYSGYELELTVFD